MRLRELPDRIDEVGFQAQLASQEPGLARLTDAQVVPVISGMDFPSVDFGGAAAGRSPPNITANSVMARICLQEYSRQH